MVMGRAAAWRLRGACAACALALGCGEAEPREFARAPDPSRWAPVAAGDDWPDEAGEPLPIPGALASHPWLGAPSRYGWRGGRVTRESAGAFAVGNGSVFGLIGLDDPVSTLTNGLGPGYQRAGSFFGDAWFELVESGAALAPDEQAAQRPRGTLVARTLARSGTLALLTTDVAVPGQDVILRHVTVRNDGPAPRSVLVRVRLARAASETEPAEPRGLVQRRGARTLLIHCDEPFTTPDASRLELTPPELAPAAEWSTTCAWSFATGAEPASEIPSLADALERSRAASLASLDRAVALELPDPKPADLYEGALLTLLAQTAPSGLVSQLHRYTSGWLRDAEGAVRLQLSAGLHEEARGVLDATYGALGAIGRISNSFPLDVDPAAFVEPADPRAFWQGVPFMEGRGRAEATSYPPLLAARYVRASGDTAWLDPGRLAFLEACLVRQEVDAAGLLPFSGDETYHIPMGAAVNGIPSSIAAFGSSAASSFLLAAAAERLAALGAGPEVAALGQRVRAAAEERYWNEELGFWEPLAFFDPEKDAYLLPYEDVSLGPLWHGFASPDDERARRNLDRVIAELVEDDATAASPRGVGVTGMVPGYLLQNLSAAGRPEAEAAFHALDRVATPSGHFEELHAFDHSVLDLGHEPDGSGSDASARYRSWETGDVAHALLAYLAGFEPDVPGARLTIAPRLPSGWGAVRVRRLRFGDRRFDLEVDAFEEGWRIVLSGPSGLTATVSLRLDPGVAFREVWEGGRSATLRRDPSADVVELEWSGGRLEIVAVR
ncbi:MAG: hypothetical protein IT376_07125 [Polyangiaceae bacterium]|nr:hypothetical protein [Polyangiaceae bacterium]